MAGPEIVIYTDYCIIYICMYIYIEDLSVDMLADTAENTILHRAARLGRLYNTILHRAARLGRLYNTILHRAAMD